MLRSQYLPYLPAFVTIISVPRALNSCHNAFISKSHLINDICVSDFFGLICGGICLSREQLKLISSEDELDGLFSDLLPVPTYFRVSAEIKISNS